MEDYEPEEKAFVQIMADKEMAQQIHRILHDLKEPYKEIFSLRIFGEYILLAISANPDYGLIYVLAGENNQIVYVELIFCNYFYGIEYKDMICEEYLPVGFDATVESPYR